MDLCEAAEDTVELARLGHIDQFFDSVGELLRYYSSGRIHRALARAGAGEAMLAAANELEERLCQADMDVESADHLRCDISFLRSCASVYAGHVRRDHAKPICGAVCMLREASRAARRGDTERAERLQKRALSRYGADEVEYVTEAYRLSFRPKPNLQPAIQRVKLGFAR